MTKCPPRFQVYIRYLEFRKRIVCLLTSFLDIYNIFFLKRFLFFKKRLMQEHRLLTSSCHFTFIPFRKKGAIGAKRCNLKIYFKQHFSCVIKVRLRETAESRVISTHPRNKLNQGEPLGIQAEGSEESDAC